VDGGHADLGLDFAHAKDAMAHTGNAVADVHLFEDSFGLWAAGAVRPSATPEQVRVLRASGISPDWRPVSRSHVELAGLVCVNSSGLKVAPQVRWDLSTGDPEPLAMVAVGAVMDDAVVELTRRDWEDVLDRLDELGEIEAYVLDERARKARSTFATFELSQRRSRALARFQGEDLLAPAPEGEAPANDDVAIIQAALDAGLPGDTNLTDGTAVSLTAGQGQSVVVMVGDPNEPVQIDAGVANGDGGWTSSDGTSGTEPSQAEAIVVLVRGATGAIGAAAAKGTAFQDEMPMMPEAPEEGGGEDYVAIVQAALDAGLPADVTLGTITASLAGEPASAVDVSVDGTLIGTAMADGAWNTPEGNSGQETDMATAIVVLATGTGASPPAEETAPPTEEPIVASGR
jgi:hypothetical protein